jgi:hypothetical protein
MAEERNVGLARAPEADIDPEATKEDLQRRMEQARESITQTVTEIKDTVANQYQQVRESISDSLDWREQYRRRPLAFSLGAAGVGLLVGYSIGGAFKGDEDSESYLYDTEEAYDVDESGGILSAASRSYAAQPILGGHDSETTAYAPQSAPQAAPPSQLYRAAGASGGHAYSGESAGDVGPDSRPSYSSGYAATGSEVEEPSGPGLMERFKGTKAYDRLQDEISTLGDRFIEELSKTAQTVVVPALLGKLKDLIGIDLSMQREVAQRSKLEHETARAGAQTTEAANQQSQAAGQTAGGGSGTSL